VKGEDVMVEMSWDISLVFIKQDSVIKTPIRKGGFHRGCIQPVKGLLCSNDHGIREGVGGFQGISKVNIDDSSKECIREEGDICIISRVR